MWDPVTDGAAYVRELVAVQQEIDRWSLVPEDSHPPFDPAKFETIDVLGFPLTADMRRTIEAITIGSYRRKVTARLFVFFSSDSASETALREVVDATESQGVVETMVGQTPWRDDNPAGGGHLPFPLLERMVELVS
jgi:hypothetical protein